MAIEYSLLLPPIPAATIDALVDLTAEVFGERNADYVTWRIAHMPDISLFCAARDGALVAFKLGYAMTRRKYYSWLGGVRPDCRRQGVAAQLMAQQHAWLAQRGYTAVETAADQDNHAMARANLRYGFSVCGVRIEPARTQILYFKALARRGFRVPEAGI